jgi:ABC-type phosphate/phosphonate transport system substrate-binding protein
VQYTRISAACAAAVTALVVAASLSGCASSAGSAADALAAAKKNTLSMETQIAAFIPKKSIVSIDQPTQSKVIFPCINKQNESYWPGTLTISLKPGLNTANLLDAIGDHWTNKTGWTVSNSTAADGTPTMDITSASGYSYTAEFAAGPVFSVTAVSACFSNSGLGQQPSY